MTDLDVSVVIPMHNEVANAPGTLQAVAEALGSQGWSFELIPVDDGSTDETGAELRRFAARDGRVRPVLYATNRGRGYAMRRGFVRARGRFVVTLDADLSYTPDHAVGMVRMLLDDPEIDLVLASPYMPGGAVEGVPFMRLAISRAGNRVLRGTLRTPVYTSTGIVRAYRREVIDALDLESDGKEIHLEILSAALALGFRIAEMPATLRTRRAGHSKFRPKSTIVSHLAFSLLERSAAIISAVGLVVLGAGLVVGIYLFGIYLTGGLNPERPLMTVMVVLFLGGAMILAFSVLALQMLTLKRDIVRLHAEVRRSRAGRAGATEATPVEPAAGNDA